MPAELFGQFFGREKIGEEAGRHLRHLASLGKKVPDIKRQRTLSNNAL
jgi:hypothetical protein